jgi:hypothetical protein
MTTSQILSKSGSATAPSTAKAPRCGKCEGARSAAAPCLVFCSTTIPQGGGEFLVKPGKPLSLLTPAQVAQRFHVDRDTVYRWRQEGLIDAKHVEMAGRRKLLIHAEAVAMLHAHFQSILDQR